MIAITEITPDLIRAARVLAGMEQTELAEAAGISLSTERRVEAGTAPPETAARVIEVLRQHGIAFIERGVRRVRSAAEQADVEQRLDSILARADAIPDSNPAFTDKDLYDEHGVPA